MFYKINCMYCDKLGKNKKSTTLFFRITLILLTIVFKYKSYLNLKNPLKKEDLLFLNTSNKLLY